jgi:ADP-heptose:LPS heptosyltransferase
MKILLSLFSRKHENPNPKDYPFAQELVIMLRKANITTIQVKTSENDDLNVDEIKSDLPLKELAEIIKECDTFISVDNFIQHYAKYLGKKGIVLWGRSDPNIFGHPQNINLLKDRKYLRPDQFGKWEQLECIPEAFVAPQLVMVRLFSALAMWREEH